MDKMQRHLQTLINTDAYKLCHRTLYPKGITTVFSNFTPRSGNKSNTESTCDGVVAVGMRFVINKIRNKFLSIVEELNLSELNELSNMYKSFAEGVTGIKDFDVMHIIDLFDYMKENKDLPIEFRAVEEGTNVNYKVPVMTLHNVDDRFYWLVNYLETWITAELWPIITAATSAKAIKDSLVFYAKETGTDLSFVDYQAHDFSFRSMEGSEAAIAVGMGHLQFFNGSDNLAAIQAAGKGSSVIATEHSIMSAGTKEKEFETYQRLIEDNPTGILSIVSDTWNIYNVMDDILPRLKDKIEARDGTLVIRPDSGDPIDQLFGKPYDKKNLCFTCVHITHEEQCEECKKEEQSLKDKGIYEQFRLGLFKLIEKHFGFTTNEKGFKVLPIKILWGEGLTISRIRWLYAILKKHGYASENLLIGVGSKVYQNVTRDTHGFAMKATYVEVNGESRNITKNPITDSGIKKSAKGLLAVVDGKLVEEATWEQVYSENNELKVVGKN